MRIDLPAPVSTRVSDLLAGEVFKFEDSFYIVTTSPASGQTCVDLETGLFVSDFSRDISDGPICHLPDATLKPHGLGSSES